MEETMMVVLVALGVGMFHHILNFALWIWATKGGIFTALIKVIKGMIVASIEGLFICAPIWYWIWVYDSNLINYFSALSGVFLTGSCYRLWWQVDQPEHIVERLRASEEVFDKRYELILFFIILSIGAAIYFQFFHK